MKKFLIKVHNYFIVLCFCLGKVWNLIFTYLIIGIVRFIYPITWIVTFIQCKLKLLK